VVIPIINQNINGITVKPNNQTKPKQIDNLDNIINMILL